MKIKDKTAGGTSFGSKARYWIGGHMVFKSECTHEPIWVVIFLRATC